MKTLLLLLCFLQTHAMMGNKAFNLTDAAGRSTVAPIAAQYRQKKTIIKLANVPLSKACQFVTKNHYVEVSQYTNNVILKIGTRHSSFSKLRPPIPPSLHRTRSPRQEITDLLWNIPSNIFFYSLKQNNQLVQEFLNARNVEVNQAASETHTDEFMLQTMAYAYWLFGSELSFSYLDLFHKSGYTIIADLPLSNTCLKAIFGSNEMDRENREKNAAIFALKMFVFSTELETSLEYSLPKKLCIQNILSNIESFLYVNYSWRKLIEQLFDRMCEDLYSTTEDSTIIDIFFQIVVENLITNSDFINFCKAKQAKFIKSKIPEYYKQVVEYNKQLAKINQTTEETDAMTEEKEAMTEEKEAIIKQRKVIMEEIKHLCYIIK